MAVMEGGTEERQKRDVGKRYRYTSFSSLNFWNHPEDFPIQIFKFKLKMNDEKRYLVK